MIHADHALARRLEGLIRAELPRLAEAARMAFPQVPAECIDVADGVALWLGEDSPVNLAAGLGMCGPVSDAELERLEAFYHERGAEAVISLCPMAERSLLQSLGRRGWQASEFEHLLVLELGERSPSGRSSAGASPPRGDPRPDVRVCMPEEREAWARTAARGFSDGAPPERGHEEFGRIMVEREEAILVLAWVDGQPAGTGSLVIDGAVGWLSGDSTLPQYRRQGIQQAIQRYRIQLAADAGCDLAVTEAAPGGASQRNMERLGFRVAYTHVEFVKSRPKEPARAELSPLDGKDLIENRMGDRHAAGVPSGEWVDHPTLGGATTGEHGADAGKKVDRDKVKYIERKIAELKARWPAHSVPPVMWQELEELEDELKELGRTGTEETHASEEGPSQLP
ncbi:MAG: GNAT family N-acetyltransferase [bacterium]